MAERAPRTADGPTTSSPVHQHAQRHGWLRLWWATRYSLQGLLAAWQEAAFRLEACLALVLLPAALWLGRSGMEVFALCLTVVLVLIVELLNSAVEAAVDRVGWEWHALAKRAKDLGSAAVLLSLLLCVGTWGGLLAARGLA